MSLEQDNKSDKSETSVPDSYLTSIETQNNMW